MEKPFLENLQPASQQSFLLRQFDRSGFDAPYHFHPEFELTYIVAGTGKRYVGNNMSNFSQGDLVLLGANLPHCWKLDNADIQVDARSIVIQFSKDFLGDDFFKKPEAHYIDDLIHQSANGIAFNGDVAIAAKAALDKISVMDSSFEKLLALLQLLQNLALDGNNTLLDEHQQVATLTATEQKRHHAVWSYLIENFRKPVSLADVAAVANLTVNAFCKYFKKVNRKTCIEAVINLRLNYAIQQLIETNRPIAEIALASGYNDVSQFHKNFRSRYHTSPLNYRKQFLKMGA